MWPAKLYSIIMGRDPIGFETCNYCINGKQGHVFIYNTWGTHGYMSILLKDSLMPSKKPYKICVTHLSINEDLIMHGGSWGE